MVRKLFNLGGFAAARTTPKTVEARRWGRVKNVVGSGQEVWERLRGTIDEKGYRSVDTALEALDFATVLLGSRMWGALGATELQRRGAQDAVVHAIAGEMARNPALRRSFEALGGKGHLIIDKQGRPDLT